MTFTFWLELLKWTILICLLQHVGSPKFQNWSDRESCPLKHHSGLLGFFPPLVRVIALKCRLNCKVTIIEESASFPLQENLNLIKFSTIKTIHAIKCFEKVYLFLFLALRKTPVHKLYSTAVGRQIQSDAPTKMPPVPSQLAVGFHHLYTHIEYDCASPFYHHNGSPRRTCLKTGKWSGRHVSCSPGEVSRAP